MKKRRKPFRRRLSLWERFTAWIQKIVWYVQGQLLDIKLKDQREPTNQEAQEAIAKIVYDTDIAPDCVSACVVRGGPTIQIKHNGASEMFIHDSYMKAADKAIEWLRTQGDELDMSDTTKLSRGYLKRFNASRRRARREDKTKRKRLN